jgi:glycogen synthase
MSASPSPTTETQTASAPTVGVVRTGKPLRILYVDGPGNVLDTFSKWRAGRHDSNEVSFAFSEEFFSLAEELNAEATVISTNDTAGELHDGNFTILHHPVPSRYRGGLSYHLGEIGFALWLVRMAVRTHANVIIVADRVHWFALWPARLFGIRIVAMLHNSLWPRGFPSNSGAFAALNKLNGLFWRSAVDATLCVSPEVERQYASVMGLTKPAHQVSPQYFPEVFTPLPPPPPIAGTLHVLFAGRIESGKGIFDLIEIALHLHAERPGEFSFELAGTGSAFAEMQEMIDASAMHNYVRLLGRLDMHGMAEAYGRSHAVIVPTNANFSEGLNRVCIEAILARRPVVTSQACPAVDVLPDAVLEVPVGDIAAYCTALKSLKDDPALYQRLAIATEKYTAAYYDRSQGYRAALLRAILKLPPGAPLPSPAAIL